ncbi:MAG: hypothetical protein KAY65_12085 [Planctomycetes bacterium]|nr:hypothetical protein [Planctomycetota bacterium]
MGLSQIKMNGIPADTTAEAAYKQLDVLRRLGIGGRAAMTFELSENLRRIVEDGVRHRHPDWDERAIQRGVAHLMLGERLFREAFGDIEEPK